MPVLALIMLLGILMSIAPRNPKTALDVRVPDNQRSILNFVQNLPPDSLIAGWPKGLMDNLPYITGRSVLVNYETHQTFHQAFVKDMRFKLNSVIDALYANKIQPILFLKNQFRVTHLIIQKDILNNIHPPEYFAPFDLHIAKVRKTLDNKKALVLRLPPKYYVYHDADFMVIDISRIQRALAQP